MTSNARTFVAVHPRTLRQVSPLPGETLRNIVFQFTCTTSTIFDCFCHNHFYLSISELFFQPYFTTLSYTPYHPFGEVGYSIFPRSFAVLTCGNCGQRVWNHSVDCSFWRFLFCMAQYISATCWNHAYVRVFSQIPYADRICNALQCSSALFLHSPHRL